MQSINPAPAVAAAAKPAEQPAEKGLTPQAGVVASVPGGSATNSLASPDGAKPAAPGNQITMKHVEAELNRLEAELAK